MFPDKLTHPRWRDLIPVWPVASHSCGSRTESLNREVVAAARKVLARNQRRDGQRGGVVLLHDTHSWSVEAFRLIMRDLERRNCELLSGDEELYDVVDSLAPFFVPAAGAPPGAPAPPAVVATVN